MKKKTRNHNHCQSLFVQKAQCFAPKSAFQNIFYYWFGRNVWFQLCIFVNSCNIDDCLFLDFGGPHCSFRGAAVHPAAVLYIRNGDYKVLTYLPLPYIIFVSRRRLIWSPCGTNRTQKTCKGHHDILGSRAVDCMNFQFMRTSVITNILDIICQYLYWYVDNNCKFGDKVFNWIYLADCLSKSFVQED